MPVCIAIVVLALSSVEDCRDESVERVDWAGLVLVASAIGLFTFAGDAGRPGGPILRMTSASSSYEPVVPPGLVAEAAPGRRALSR